MNRCIVFYNFGNKCILELLVATYTLRKHYTGEIVWMLANNDEWNQTVATQVANLNVKIVWTDLNLIKRNAKSAVKPYLFNKLFTSGYDSVLMCDGDLLFLKPIDELWVFLEKSGILVTNFCGWNTGGNIMRGRLEQMSGMIPDTDLKHLIDAKYPALNIGVMGFTKDKGKEGLELWDSLTQKLAGKHIADEVAVHALLLKNIMIVPSTFNASAKIGDLSHIEDNHIVHFHGSAQGGGEVDIRYEDRRRSSRLWMAHLYEFTNSGLVQEALMWIPYATGGINEILQKNPNLPFECWQEFYGN